MSKLAINESAVRNNKRKRCNGTNPNARPEMKRWNPFNITNIESFSSINIGNGYVTSTGDPLPTMAYLSWHPVALGKPNQGPTAFNRVGESFFLRYLRFKGYIEIKRFPVYQMHYRLRLIRTDGLELKNPLDYLSLFKKIEKNWKVGP